MPEIIIDVGRQMDGATFRLSPKTSARLAARKLGSSRQGLVIEQVWAAVDSLQTSFDPPSPTSTASTPTMSQLSGSRSRRQGWS